jgi:predicted DNA-binding transcriptional regulator YafY
VRAERLLAIMMLLRARGRMTAAVLASHLEVSERTIHRDLCALSAAGVPVIAHRGGRGGWDLDAAYETRLTGMSTKEALAIVVGRPPRLLSDLGLGDSAPSAIGKLLAALPPEARAGAEYARQRVHVDLQPWDGRPEAEAVPALRVLQRAVWENRMVRMRYGPRRAELRVAPLGLVAKGTTWYLVALRGEHLRTYRVSRVVDAGLADETFIRSAAFDLERTWNETCSNFIDSLPSYLASLRLGDMELSRLRWTAGARVETVRATADRWSEVQVTFENEHEAVSAVLSLGPRATVVDPLSLRRRVETAARALAALNMTEGVGRGSQAEPMTAQDLLAILETSWTPLRERLGHMTEADLDRVLSRGGTVRERAAEAAFWVETIPPVIAEGVRRGGQVPLEEWHGGDRFVGWPDSDGHFIREAAWARRHRTDELLGRMDRAQSRARSAVSTLSDAEIASGYDFAGLTNLHIEDKIRSCGDGLYAQLLADLA